METVTKTDSKRLNNGGLRYLSSVPSKINGSLKQIKAFLVVLDVGSEASLITNCRGVKTVSDVDIVLARLLTN